MEPKIHNRKSLVLAFCVAFFGMLTVSLLGNDVEITQDTIQSLPQNTETKINVLPRKETLLVFGDVMLDRYIRNYITASGTALLFEYVQEDITAADRALINLEGPITDYPPVVSNENLQFTFATHTAQDLATAGIDIVSLANNHTHNFGRSGLEQTRDYLDKAGIIYFGGPYNETGGLVVRHTLGSTTLSFVGFHQFENPELTDILNVITVEKDAGNYVIFFPHWGTEYEKQANEYQRKITQQIINAGADIVIGAHPHVIQNLDEYQGKPVFYSLGNFIFDQWFSEDVKYGLAVLLTFTENRLESVELKPFYRNRYQPKWLVDEERTNWCNVYIKNTSFISEPNNSCLLIQ